MRHIFTLLLLLCFSICAAATIVSPMVFKTCCSLFFLLSFVMVFKGSNPSYYLSILPGALVIDVFNANIMFGCFASISVTIYILEVLRSNLGIKKDSFLCDMFFICSTNALLAFFDESSLLMGILAWALSSLLCIPIYFIASKRLTKLYDTLFGTSISGRTYLS